MCLHIGTGFGAISMAPNAPIDNLIILATQVSAMCAQDLLWGPAMRNYPDLKFAFSEGGIGWIPFYLDRSDRHYTNQKWLRRDFGDKLPSDVFREHSLACYVTDKTSLKLRHEIGIDIIAWECDYPHSDSTWPRTREIAEGMGKVFGLSADALQRHPIALVGTPDEMIEELRRREREHGLSLLALNFTSLEQQRDFGARVLPHVR